MKVLMLSTDAELLREESASRERHRAYARVFGELHIVVVMANFQFSILNFQTIFNSQFSNKIQISRNVWVYTVGARTKVGVFLKTLLLGKKIISSGSSFPPPLKLRRAGKFQVSRRVVTAQDPFELGLIAWTISRLTGAALHLQIHTDFLSPYFARHSLRNRLRVRLARFLLPRASGIRVVSQRISDSLQTTDYKLQTTPIVLPIFTDTEKIQNAPVTTDLRAKYPQFDRIVLMVARLAPEKNIPLALKVIQRVAAKHPRIGLIIVGDGHERERLHGLVGEKKLENTVIFEGTQSDITSYYKTADVLLLTSDYEGYGLILVEAGAAGLPIVTTDVGVAPEVVCDGESGFVCPVGDATCLSEKVLAALEGRKVRDTARVPDHLPSGAARSGEEYLGRFKDSIASAL